MQDGASAAKAGEAMKPVANTAAAVEIAAARGSRRRSDPMESPYSQEGMNGEILARCDP
jgi:hypothetical protein